MHCPGKGEENIKITFDAETAGFSKRRDAHVRTRLISADVVWCRENAPFHVVMYVLHVRKFDPPETKDGHVVYSS